MTDPYSVLGLDASATDEQVREAYRRLAVKYSTDEYANSSLGDIAAKEMADIDAAFDRIMSQRRVGGARKTSNNTNSGGRNTTYTDAGRASSDTDDWRYHDIREHLRRGDYVTAEQRLLAIDGSQRGAQWNFLMGSVCREKGWLDEARRYYASAASMEPNNYEYTAAYNQLEQSRATGQGNYRPFGTTRRDDGCADDLSSCCSLLCCMSLCNSCCCNGR